MSSSIGPASGGAPAGEEHLSLRPGVGMASNSRTLLLFRQDLARRSQAFGAPSPAKRSVLDALAHGYPTAAQLLGEHAHETGTATFLDALRAGGWLTVVVRDRDHDLYTVQPQHPRPAHLECAGHLEQPALGLSRFAVLHGEESGLVVESPLANARIKVHDPRVLAVIGRLALPTATSGTSAGQLSTELENRILRDLVQAGLAVHPSAEEAPDLRQWRPHELWFHARSRMGNGGHAGAGFGRTWWAKELFEPTPPRREPFPGTPIDLSWPDPVDLRESDRSLSTVLEHRHTRRAYDDDSPVTLAQLGEFLHRSAGVRHSVNGDGTVYESRPYPSGGAAYELELYPVVRLVAGLEPGMYHYDPHDHSLRLVRGGDSTVARLLRFATAAANMPAPPQVLIVIAARFGRLMRVYEELPYSLVLKHVGVLYQNMYLVATSMGLAPCGLGAGDVVAFAEATGLDYVAESSVGEFLLGSRRTEGDSRGSAVAS